MPTATAINFSDLGSNPTVQIPANYQSFDWLAYTDQEDFQGSPNVILGNTLTTPPARAIYGTGFQMTSTQSFDLNSLSVAPNNGSGQLDVTIKALRHTSGNNFELVASFVIRSSTNPSVSNLIVKNINQLQVISNSMDTFDTADISIVR